MCVDPMSLYFVSCFFSLSLPLLGKVLILQDFVLYPQNNDLKVEVGESLGKQQYYYSFVQESLCYN